MLPFQCILYCSRSSPRKSDVLLCASVQCIYSFDVSNGRFLSKWPPWGRSSIKNPEKTPGCKSYENATNPTIPEWKEANSMQLQDHELSSKGDDSDSTSTEIKEDVKGQRSHELDRVLSLDVSTAVIKLAGTSNGQYIIAVTDEDKCIRVLELQDDGSLIQRCARPMPKRPCSITLTSDEFTILCADKFGDVYSLPLLGLPYSPTPPNPLETPAAASDLPELQPVKPFTPAANSKTVHTKKNLESLRLQMRTTNQKPQNKTLQFEHQLLLGHVSLLTDVVSVRIPAGGDSRQRSYILTADRDEHIRVSRGIPQTYVIEGYCLGHTEFVSKLCVPNWDRSVLISGGGDDFLLVWDWLTGTVRQKVDLKGPLEAFKAEYVASLAQPGALVPADACYENGEVATERLETEGPIDAFGNEYLGSSTTNPLIIDNDDRKIAVSGIWALQTPPSLPQGYIFLALEAVPAIFMFHLDQTSALTFHTSHPLAGNLLDLALLGPHSSIIYSIDHMHRPFSTKHETYRQEERGSNSVGRGEVVSRAMVGGLKFVADDAGGKWQKDEALEKVIAAIDQHRTPNRYGKVRAGGKGGWDGGALGGLLYGLENLRKRPGNQEQEE